MLQPETELQSNYLKLASLFSINEVQNLLGIWKFEECKELFFQKGITGYSLLSIHSNEDLLGYELDLTSIGYTTEIINELLEMIATVHHLESDLQSLNVNQVTKLLINMGMSGCCEVFAAKEINGQILYNFQNATQFESEYNISLIKLMNQRKVIEFESRIAEFKIYKVYDSLFSPAYTNTDENVTNNTKERTKSIEKPFDFNDVINSKIFVPKVQPNI